MRGDDLQPRAMFSDGSGPDRQVRAVRSLMLAAAAAAATVLPAIRCSHKRCTCLSVTTPTSVGAA